MRNTHLKLSTRFFLILSTIVLPSKVQAQSIDILFSGTVNNSCSFSTPTPGKLTQSTNYAAIESSGISQGKGVQVSVNCGAGGKLTVETPSAVQVPANFNASTLQSIVKRGNGSTSEDIASASSGGTFSAISNSATPTMILPAGTSDLNVGMIAGQNIPGTIPNGDYRYTVKVTIAPN
jgi:hypothetical protein